MLPTTCVLIYKFKNPKKTKLVRELFKITCEESFYRVVGDEVVCEFFDNVMVPYINL